MIASVSEARGREYWRRAWTEHNVAFARLGLGGLLATAVLGLGTSASALPAPSRVIDRTFGCTPAALNASLRAVDVHAVPIGAAETYDPSLEDRSPGFIGVASGGWSPGSELVSIRARVWQRFTGTYSFEGVYASMRRCSSSRTSLPLSAKGLPGPPVRWAKQVTCVARGRVLVRVRAVLQSPASWQPLSNAYDGARRKVVEAALAIRSEPTGKPIAYMELDRNGKTKLWYSPRCT